MINSTRIVYTSRYSPLHFLSSLGVVRLLAAVTMGVACGTHLAYAENRWHLAEGGGIAWVVKPGEVHQDNVEMSGKRVSVVVTYGVNESNKLSVSRQVIWPMLRFHPNKTHDHFAVTFSDDALPRVSINQLPARNEMLNRVWQKGILRFEGVVGRNHELAFSRAVFPSVDQPACFDVTTYTNRSEKEVTVGIEENDRSVRTLSELGVYGGYEASAQVLGTGLRILKPGESTQFTVVLSARRMEEKALVFDIAAEEQARLARIESFLSRMQLQTPDPMLNTMFNFAKIRVAESVYETRGGPMHGPGGATYYAAIWANDSAEYTYPFYAMFGDELAVVSGINSYRHFARFMNPEYRPIPSSIISEGAGIWHGAKDRGDMAMLACGASRFALAYGRKSTAEELWPLIEWSLEYCRRKIDGNGVVASDSDELENRFPSGQANLATSSLYFDALNSAVFLGRELGKAPDQLANYAAQAAALRAAIERHFGASVEGFETYRYFDKATPSAVPRHAHYANEPDHLRAWIGVALAVGLNERSTGTIDALLSPKLWTPDGLATESGKADFWDRSTLYALRGIFVAGGTERALDRLTFYSNRRLLGDHVPYPVEAYPEGNQRHLSAEGALYCRIFTEGLFGIRPTGLRSFNLTPRLPQGWPDMMLKRVQAFDSTFDLTVSRSDGGLRVRVSRTGLPSIEKTINEGATLAIDLN